MWKKRVALAIAAVGLLLIGFEGGQYIVMKRDPRPKPPRKPTPVYPGERPRAEFQTAPSPAAAAAVRPAESPDALSDVLREPDPFARASQLSALLPTLGPEAIPEAREALEGRAAELGGAEIPLLARFWATHDPAGASEWAFLRSPVDHRVAAILASIEVWAQVDPVAAKDEVQEMLMLPSQNARAIQNALVRGWFASGLPGLEDYIRSLEVMSIARQRALRTFFRAAIRRDGPEPIARWAEALPDEDTFFKKEAFRQLGSELADADPAAAVAWCEAHCEGPFGTSVRQLIAQRWALQDGPAAMQWVSTAPPGRERDRAAQGAFRGWWRGDAGGFRSYMSALGFEGVEPWFEPVLEAYAGALVIKTPEEAIQWAERITDDVVRERTFVNVARNWRQRDESAAEAWLEQSPLSEEARQRVRAPKKPRTGSRSRRRPAPDAEGFPDTLETPFEASPAP